MLSLGSNGIACTSSVETGVVYAKKRENIPIFRIVFSELRFAELDVGKC
jgi:hypothetical protein